MYKRKDINRINEIILSGFKNIERLILFGSYAKGTAKEGSDIDFAIITQEKINRIKKLQVLNQLWSNLAKEGYEVDLIVKPLENFESEKKLLVRCHTAYRKAEGYFGDLLKKEINIHWKIKADNELGYCSLI